MEKKHINTLASLGLIMVGTAIVFLIAYPSSHAPTDTFGVILFCCVILFAAVIVGLSAMALRFLNKINPQANFLYNFIGTLNLSLGLLGIVMLIGGRLTEIIFIAIFALSFIIGSFICSDIYSSKNTHPSKSKKIREE